MNQSEFDDPVKSPEIQDIILGGQIGCIAAEISDRLDITPAKALILFYRSKTCEHLHNKETGLYLYGNQYIVDDFMEEWNQTLSLQQF